MTDRKTPRSFIDAIKGLLPGLIVIGILIGIFALLGDVPEMYHGVRGR